VFKQSVTSSRHTRVEGKHNIISHDIIILIQYLVSVGSCAIVGDEYRAVDQAAATLVKQR